jgi:hypothetical protein
MHDCAIQAKEFDAKELKKYAFLGDSNAQIGAKQYFDYYKSFQKAEEIT